MCFSEDNKVNLAQKQKFHKLTYMKMHKVLFRLKYCIRNAFFIECVVWLVSIGIIFFIQTMTRGYRVWLDSLLICKQETITNILIFCEKQR